MDKYCNFSKAYSHIFVRFSKTISLHFVRFSKKAQNAMHCVCSAYQQTRSLLSPSPLCLHHPIKPARNKREYPPKRACHRPFSPQQNHFPNQLRVHYHPIPLQRIAFTKHVQPHLTPTAPKTALT